MMPTRQRHIEILLLTAVLCINLFLASCSTYNVTGYNRMYRGGALPNDKVAFLTTQPINWGEVAETYIHTVDGETVKRSFNNEAVKIEILPGYHDIEVSFHRGFLSDSSPSHRTYTYYNSAEILPLRFYAEPGHTYRVIENTDQSLRSWQPVIIDAN
mgnify:FL=1